MGTLLIFAALVYLVGFLRIDARITPTLQFILALVGLLLWLLGCVGIELPACFR